MKDKTASSFASVTTICCMHISNQYFHPKAAKRGSMVHLWANRYLNGIWDPFNEEKYPIYVGGLKKWLEDNKAKLLYGEIELKNNELEFRGHPDFIGTIKSEEGIGLIDFKTSDANQPWWKIQLAAYFNLVDVNKEELKLKGLDWAASLRVDKEGKTTFKKYTREEMTKESFKKFLNLLYFNKKVYTLEKVEDNAFYKHIQKVCKKQSYSTGQALANYIRFDPAHKKSLFGGVKGI